MVGGIALFVLLLSAIKNNDHLVCTGLNITIDDNTSETFINEKEVKKILESNLGNQIIGSQIEQLNIKKMEKELLKNPWVSNAQLYIDNQQELHVGITERIPVARVFTEAGQSFYLDSTATVLPLSDNQTANVTVFTNLPNHQIKMHPADSLVWHQVCNMGKFIKNDSMLLMQIGQVDVIHNAGYEMFPTIGTHIIQFGNGENMADKFRRLSMFYKQVFGKVGLNKYATIDLRFENQVVATLRGKETAKIDSLKAMNSFQQMINQSLKESEDSTLDIKINLNELHADSSLLPKSLDGINETEKETIKQPIKPAVKLPAHPFIPITQPVKHITRKPKSTVLHHAPVIIHKTPKPKPVPPHKSIVLQHAAPKKVMIKKPEIKPTQKNDY